MMTTTEYSTYHLDDGSGASPTFTMPPMIDGFPDSYDFDSSNTMPPFSFDSDGQRLAVVDPTIMWGGMSQMSLQQPSVQKAMAGNNPLLHQSANHVSHYGQITPPNDTTPTIDPELAKQLADSENAQAARPKSKRPKREPSKRKPKSNEQDETKPKKAAKTTRKARKGYRATTKEEEDDSDGEEKREKFLERNRVAASKCRQKKKEWTSGLESQARDLAAQNAQLHSYALTLRDEVLMLKSECLKHTDCKCARIREYLDRSIAGMQPSGALQAMPQRGNQTYRKHSDVSHYTFNTATSATGASRQGSLALETENGDDMSATSEQEMQALLEASITSPPAADSPQSTAVEQ